jgi:hypothetical protein
MTDLPPWFRLEIWYEADDLDGPPHQVHPSLTLAGVTGFAFWRHPEKLEGAGIKAIRVVVEP